MSIKPLSGADALTLHQMSEPASDSIRMSKDQMEAAKAFEAYMVEMMVKEMRKTIPDGMFSGESTEIFSGLFDQEISKRIAETGGFGFDEVMGQALNGERLRLSHPHACRWSQQPVAGNPAATVHDHDHDHHHHHHDHGPGEMPVEGVITSRFGLRRIPSMARHAITRGWTLQRPLAPPFTQFVQELWSRQVSGAATVTSWFSTMGTAPLASMLTVTSSRSRRGTRWPTEMSLRR